MASMSRWVQVALVAGVATVECRAQTESAALSMQGALTSREALRVQVTQPAFVTVFVVGRGASGTEIQLLSAERGEARLITRGGRCAPRALTQAERRRFSLTEETVVVAIASTDRPRLDAFVAGEENGGYLVVADSIVADGNRLIGSLAGELFAPNVQYSAMIRQDVVTCEPTIASLQRLTREPADRCGPDGVPNGRSMGNLQQANTISRSDAFRAVDFASGRHVGESVSEHRMEVRRDAAPQRV